MEVGNGSLGFNKNTTDKKLTKKVENLEKRIEEIEEGNIDVNLEEYAKKEDLPSKTSELTNDSNFADEKYVDDAIDFLEKVQLSDEMPTNADVIMWVNTSEDMEITSIPRINDKVVSSTTIWTSERIDKQITNKIAQAKLEEEEIDLSNYATKDELHEHTNKTILDELTEEMVSNWNNKSEFDGDYNNLTNKPNIPSIEGLASEDYVNTYVEEAIKDIPKEEIDLSGYALKTDIPTVPTKLSEFTNDSNFISEIPSEYITETELEEKKYLTEHQDLSNYATKNELHNHTNKTVLDIITEEMVSNWNNKSEFSGNYNDLTNKPTIPSIEGLASEDYVNNAIENIDIPQTDLSEYALKTDIPTNLSDLINDNDFVNKNYVEDKIVETTNSMEIITSSNTVPTDENVTIWINTSEDTATNPLARVSDEIVSDEHTWSSEKINNLFNNLKLVKEGSIIKLMLGDIELSNISIE